jgi:hypothetical protein
MKKLAICGDSWMTPTLSHPDTHFSEIIAKHYNVELLALSRGGCSNGAICLQIEESIKQNADFVIIGATTPDRIEIPLPKNKLPKLFLENWSIFGSANTRFGKYKKNRGLSNISYDRHPDLSTQNNFMTDPVLISESLNNLLWPENNINNYYSLPKETIESLFAFVSNLYDPAFKRQIDCWCISNALRKLQDNNTNFLFLKNSLFNNEFLEDITWIPQKNIANIHRMYVYEEGSPVYHTLPQTQIYFAEQLKKLIDNLSINT